MPFLRYTASITHTLSWRGTRRIRYFWQRLTRGFDDTETWGLDSAFARLMLPRVRQYLTNADPVIVIDEDFRDGIALIERALVLLIRNGDGGVLDPGEEVEIDICLQAFATYIRGMWW